MTVVLALQFNDNLARGPALWKFNNSVLRVDDFCAFAYSKICLVPLIFSRQPRFGGIFSKPPLNRISFLFLKKKRRWLSH